jgi:quaternary ammonium compound-resistance protein SugE
MAWVYVIIAGLLEVAWALGLKASEGLSRPLVTIATVVGMIASFVVLSQGMKTLPVGTAYAVWTGIGAAGAAIFGIIFFNDPKDWPRLVCIGLIVVGTLGLKTLSKG